MARFNNHNVFFVVSLVLAVCGAIAAFQSTRQAVVHRRLSAAAAFRPSSSAASSSSWGVPHSCTDASARRETNRRTTWLASSPSILEREQVRTSGPAVLDRPSTEERRSDVKERVREGGEAWEVRIYNDGMNTREHVARALVQITGMTEMTAYQTMMQAHQNGIASVGRFCFEIAEMYHEGLRQQGIISDIVPVDEDS